MLKRAEEQAQEKGKVLIVRLVLASFLILASERPFSLRNKSSCIFALALVSVLVLRR